ncbi:hypothetical protein [Yinghuangia sp. YIM S09857]|uniref:hypothetical protein n=1 Tax=Yinghuangia sp. YIM S09857 TaxID=3436929 RepID=UPI003F53B65A
MIAAIGIKFYDAMGEGYTPRSRAVASSAFILVAGYLGGVVGGLVFEKYRAWANAMPTQAKSPQKGAAW